MSGYTDSTPMPFGKHRGTKLIDVPAKDLLWLYENNRCNWELKMYIKKNLEVIKQQANQK